MALTALQAFGALFRLAASYILSPVEAFETIFPNIKRPAGASRFDPVRDIPSLAGKVILVTGGNAGIGLETVLQLAKHDPKHIYLAARTGSKAKTAIDLVRTETGFDGVSWLPLDLTLLSSVEEAAQRVLQQTDRLDVLVLNAGIMATPAATTDAGHDTQLGTNHVGHFFLTKLLLPKLLGTARLPNSDVRVITVASAASSMAPAFDTIISTEKLNRADPWTRYGASKAANVMFAAELARRYPILTSVSVHPGLIRTDLYTPSASASLVLQTFLRFVSWAFVSVQEGALTQLYVAAGARREDLENGQYYTPYGTLRKSSWASNADRGIRLWEWTEAELTRAGFV